MKHILFTLKGCPPYLLNDGLHILSTVQSAAKEAKATLLNISHHEFEPQGVTCVAMLAESHISIHTWPELGQAVCDVFTCGDETMPFKAMEFMKEFLFAKDCIHLEVSRHLDESAKICYDK